MNNKLILIVVISVIFGLGGGIVGQVVSRVYLMDNVFKVPFMGDIDIKDANMGGKNLVISNPKKVVVEQNEKVIEVANGVSGGIVGIFKKIASTTTEKVVSKGAFDIANYYKSSDVLGQGFIITSDGWVMSGFLPKELTEKKNADLSNKNIFDEYVVITKDKKIFNVKNIKIDKNQAYSFWKVEAQDLPVRVFASEKDINNGQSVMAVNWNDSILISTILSKEDKKKSLVISSDDYLKKITLNNKPSSDFFGSFLFDYAGNLVGFINNDGSVGFIGNYISCINCLLENGTIKRASLGVSYIDLSSLIRTSENKYPENGALLVASEKWLATKKASSTNILKLKIDDVIISVNGITLDKNNQLTDLIGSYKPGEIIDVVYLRDDNKENIAITLGELN